MSNQLPGTQLKPQDQKYVLAAYVHRFTRDHKPKWANQARPDGTEYPVQFDSDADWLEHTLFKVTKHGDLDRRTKHCFSNPTWPDNPELRK